MKSTTLYSLLAALWGQMLVASPAVAQQVPYSVISLGVIGGNYSIANGVNQFDEVVGISTTGALDSYKNAITHGFLWTPTSGMRDLFPGAGNAQLYTTANAVNVAGEITGSYSQPGILSLPNAYVYQPGAGMIDFNQQNTFSTGYALSEDGMAAGAQNGDLSLLDPNGGGVATQTSVSGAGYAIDTDYHDVVGVMLDSGGAPHAVVYWGLPPYAGQAWDMSATTDNYYNYPAAMLGMAGIFNIVGYATNSYGYHTAMYWVDEAEMPLGYLPGTTWSEGHGVNSSGQIVGQSGKRAFLATASFPSTVNMIDLNRLIAPRSPWVLQNATGINEFGDIVGEGLYNGQQRAFLAVPVVIYSVSVSPDSVKGGQSAVGTVTLDYPAPFDIKVSMNSSNSLVSVPKTVKIAAGDMSADFNISTKTVTNPAYATLRAGWGGWRATTHVTVTP